MVLRNVRRFMVVEHTHEFPFCSSLIAHFEKPWLLVIAALFHDIAKGRGGDHSELGKADIRKFAKDHGLDKADTELLIWLVAEHLNMSQVAQKPTPMWCKRLLKRLVMSATLPHCIY
jgi:[protein-PII] uridylyltransferase